MSFMIIVITSDVLKISSEKIRYISGAAAGGLFSFLILAPTLNVFVMLVLKAVTAAIIVLLAFGLKSVRSFVKCFLMFIFISVFLSGVLYLIGSMTYSNRFYHNNGVLYADFSAGGLVVIVCCLYFFIKLVNRRIFSKQKDDIIYNVQLESDGRFSCFNALYDSGNSVIDIYTGKPVIIVELSEMQLLLDDKFYDELSTILSGNLFDDSSGKIRLLPVRTLGTEKIIPVFSVDKAVITNDNMKRVIYKPSVAVTDNTFDKNKYTALINEAVTGQVI